MNRLIIAFVVVLMLALTAFSLQARFRAGKRKKLLDKGFIMATATIKQVGSGSSYRNSVCYSFSYDGSGFNDCELYHLSSALIDKLPGAKVPVIFLKGKPEVNQILLCQDDFLEYNVPCPDSLRWIDSLR